MRQPGLFVTILVSAIAAGCSLHSGPSRHVLEYTERQEERKLGNCDSVMSGCVTVTLRYPVLSAPESGPLHDSLEAYVRPFLYTNPRDGQILTGVEALAESASAQYRDLTRRFPDYRIDWYLERDAQVLADSGGIVSLRCTQSIFLGGAHPLTTVTLVNFEANSGRLLGADEVIDPGSEQTFTRILERAFRKARNLAPGVDLKSEGFWIEPGKFPRSSNVGVRPDGLLVFYNPYEVAPYSMGPTEVFLPFSDLVGMVPPEGPLAELARR